MDEVLNIAWENPIGGVVFSVFFAVLSLIFFFILSNLDGLHWPLIGKLFGWIFALCSGASLIVSVIGFIRDRFR